MKKLIAVAASAMAFASMAAMEEIAKVRLTDATGLVSAAMKIGEMSGNGMIGAAAAAQINELEVFKFFGPARSGSPIVLSVLADTDKVDESDFAEWISSFGATILYPIDGKDQFLAKHVGYVETNGLVLVKDSSYSSCSMFNNTYLAFSKDGKWVAASDKPEQAKSALALASDASKPMGSDVVKVSIGAKGMKSFVSFLEKAAEFADKKGEKPYTEADIAFLKGISSFSGAIRVSSSGIDFRAKVGAVKGSEFDKMGLTALAKDPLAFAGANAISASSVAAGASGQNNKELIDAVFAAIAKRGIKLDFLGFKSVPGRVTFNMDVPALIKYAQGEGAEAFGKVDPEELVEEIRKIVSSSNKGASPTSAPAFSGSFAIKGYKPKASPAEMFAKTLPEVGGKPVYVVHASSIYAFVKGVVPQVLAALPPEISGQVKPLVASLPEEGERGIAQAYWRDGDAHVGVCRISADEIRGIGATVNAAMGIAMANAMQQGAGNVIEDDDSDDED